MKRILIAVCGALLLATFVVCDEGISNETKRTANPSTVVAKEETSLPKDDIGKGLATSENPPPATAEVNMQGGKDKKYVGAESCKNCHRAKASGEQYNKWKEWKMAKAFDTLAGDKAKEIAKKQGVDDPQKSDKCLKCHVTAFDVADALLDKKFDKKQGIQCESCHGPGEQHVKNRMSAPEDEDE